MRILVVGTEIDRVEAELFSGLARAGVKITYSCSPSARFQDLLRAAGVEFIHLEIRSRFDFRAIFALRRLFKEHDFDLVHALTARALNAVIMASIGFRHKVVAYRGTVGRLSWFDPTSLLGFLNPRVAAVICVSEAVRSYLRDLGVPETRLARIYKGHDPAWYRDVTGPSFESLHLSADQFVVACTANMRPVKGVDVLLRALALIPKEKPIEILLVGAVIDSRLPKLICELGIKDRVVLAGYVPDGYQLTRQADVFVMPSREREGFPRSVLEAMAMGVPPIVTAVGGMPELVEHGQSGLVVPPDSPVELAQAILKLYQDDELRARLAERATARIEGPMHIRETLAATIELYERISGLPIGKKLEGLAETKLPTGPVPQGRVYHR